MTYWSVSDGVATNLSGVYCAEQNCKAGVLRVFPGQLLDVLVDDVLEAAKAGDRAAQTARKLLFDTRFRK
jgi:hypothetical protein